MDTSQTQYLDSIAALMKRGRSDEITEFFQEQPEQSAETFTSYMDELISRSKMSRSKIISNVGLSRDYMYKVLRGDKQTTERDYIIAVCLSMKANVLETQKALELYPFPILDSQDMRSAIILSAINAGQDRYTLDEWLGKMNLPLLRVSPDMPSVKVGPVRSTHYSESLVNSEVDEGENPSQQRRFIEMEITHTFKVVEHFGNAPFDFFYLAEYELTDEDGEKVYAQANYWPDGQCGFGISKKTVENNFDDDPAEYMLETYYSLEEASDSKYFSYFLDLDRLTDKMAAEKMAEVNDTKTYGFRAGATNSAAGFMIHAEAFNEQEPARIEYLQIRQKPEGFIFSMSHKSYFMQMELDSGLEGFYEIYFGKPEKQLYVFEVNSLDNLGMFQNYRPAFEEMLGKIGFPVKH